ncbi:MAG: hypothetical protein JWO69_1992, partial [Thermoleophilia bacterium]|nr:hypothetical protein [Thermoleophilia bacterium]
MGKSCDYRDCERDAVGHGLCQAHGWQRRHGQELRPIAARKGYRQSLLRNEQGEKCCATCEQWQPVENFTPDASKADGLVQWCRPCASRYKTEWRYGLRRGRVAEMLAAQDNACAICSESFAGSRYYVDHDHACCPSDKACGKCVRAL